MSTTTDNTDNVLVEIKDLHYKRGNKSIFSGIDASINRGEITAIMGPSGTGKTTLLKMIGGQLRPDQGEVYFDGLLMSQLGQAELYRTRRNMGVLFQNGALLTDINVFDNVAFPLREHSDLPESMIRDLVLMKLEAVGLRGAASLFVDELSGGMARRVALARAIALDPYMIMYDEPFAGQDPISMGVLMRLIRRLNDSLGLTSVIVSHDVNEVLSIADRVFVLSEGRVIERGTPEDIRASQSQWVRQFVDAQPDGPVPFHYPAEDFSAALLDSNPR